MYFLNALVPTKLWRRRGETQAGFDVWCLRGSLFAFGGHMLWLRALVSFLTCPAIVAGLIPILLVRGHDVYTGWLTFSLPVLGVGLFALLWCVRDFYVSGRGTLAPWDPPKRLVVVGMYRFVRNPMYVAVLTVLFGWSLLYRSWLLAGYAVVLATVFHFRVVLHEEPWLERQFGVDWQDYAARVPRWWPARLSPP